MGMNKKEFIAQEINKNKLAFGRWYSSKEINSADRVKLMLCGSPKNETESLQHGNALANTGDYPVGTDGCFNVGISGGCGPECFVYLHGDCTEPDEMIGRLSSNELSRHANLYGGTMNEALK
jgi:hypothetical protein